jgi:phage gp45-like
VWEDGADDGQVFTTESAAQDAQGAEIATQGSEFTVTLTATADLQGGFTVAFYNRSGTEITTDMASQQSGPDLLTAGQHAKFMDYPMAPITGAAFCQVIAGPGN